MQALQNFNAHALIDTLISLVAAFAHDGAIGLERQIRRRTSGLRTNTLVAVGVAIFVALGNRPSELHGGGSQGPCRSAPT
jgi:putative Mg2+ transporter-C (MgtC) family protein